MPQRDGRRVWSNVTPAARGMERQRDNARRSSSESSKAEAAPYGGYSDEHAQDKTHSGQRHSHWRELPKKRPLVGTAHEWPMAPGYSPIGGRATGWRMRMGRKRAACNALPPAAQARTPAGGAELADCLNAQRRAFRPRKDSPGEPGAQRRMKWRGERRPRGDVSAETPQPSAGPPTIVYLRWLPADSGSKTDGA